MAFEPLRFGRPIDVLSQNRFWTKVWVDNPGNAGSVFEMKFARMWHNDSVVLVGDALVRYLLGSDHIGRFPYHSYWSWTTAAQNNSFEHYFTLDAGTYTFVVLCRTAQDAGIVSWKVDGVSIGTTDIYAASGAEFVLKTIAGVTISADGNHTLTGTVSSKNASSTNYHAYLYKYQFLEA